VRRIASASLPPQPALLIPRHLPTCRLRQHHQGARTSTRQPGRTLTQWFHAFPKGRTEHSVVFVYGVALWVPDAVAFFRNRCVTCPMLPRLAAARLSPSQRRAALGGRLKSCLGRSPARNRRIQPRRLCRYPHPALSWKGEGAEASIAAPHLPTPRSAREGRVRLQFSGRRCCPCLPFPVLVRRLSPHDHLLHTSRGQSKHALSPFRRRAHARTPSRPRNNPRPVSAEESQGAGTKHGKAHAQASSGSRAAWIFTSEISTHKDRSTPEARKLRSLVAVVFLSAQPSVLRAPSSLRAAIGWRHLGCGGRHAPCGSLRGSAFVFS